LYGDRVEKAMESIPLISKSRLKISRLKRFACNSPYRQKLLGDVGKGSDASVEIFSALENNRKIIAK
jgi:hypothetical protein